MTENEQLEMIGIINRQKAEIERLEVVKKHIDIVIHRDCEYPSVETYNEAFQKALEQLYDNATAKAEAVKEFAERLLLEFPSGSFSYSHIRYKANNLLKELVGDSNV